MDISFILSAIIFTLLAIVVATSVFNRSSPSADFAKGCFGHTGEAKAGGLSQDKSAPKQNGHISDKTTTADQKKTTAVNDWTEVCGSSHDHWDVVKSVLSEESLSNPGPAEPETTTTSSHASSSKDMSVDSSPETSSSRSVMGLSEKELLKCAFSQPQTEDGPGSDDEKEVDADGMPLKYVPGMLRTSQMQMMMSRDELVEEQRVQREQLAAIFQLLRDNRETFGEVSEVDMEEQLKLYSV